jgi:hypothetical protein
MNSFVQNNGASQLCNQSALWQKNIITASPKSLFLANKWKIDEAEIAFSLKVALIARAPNRLKMCPLSSVGWLLFPKVLLRRQMPSRYASSRSIQRGSSFCRRAKCIGKSTHQQGRPFCMSYFSVTTMSSHCSNVTWYTAAFSVQSKFLMPY